MQSAESEYLPVWMLRHLSPLSKSTEVMARAWTSRQKSIDAIQYTRNGKKDEEKTVDNFFESWVYELQ